MLKKKNVRWRVPAAAEPAEDYKDRSGNGVKVCKKTWFIYVYRTIVFLYSILDYSDNTPTAQKPVICNIRLTSSPRGQGLPRC